MIGQLKRLVPLKLTPPVELGGIFRLPVQYTFFAGQSHVHNLKVYKPLPPSSIISPLLVGTCLVLYVLFFLKARLRLSCSLYLITRESLPQHTLIQHAL